MVGRVFSFWTDAVAESATLKLVAEVARLKREGREVFNFGAGEPDFNTPSTIIEAAHKAMLEGKIRYTSPRGIEELRYAAAEKTYQLHTLSYNPLKETIITAGAKQAIFAALCTLLNPDDEVLILSPYWVSYPDIVRIAGGKPVILSSTMEEDFLPSVGAIKNLITERTKALIMNSPNNPSGVIYPKEVIERLVDVALEHNLWIISDEVYHRLLLDNDTEHISPAMVTDKIRRRCLLAYSCSKTYAMTGWRVGYAFGPERLITNMAKLIGQSTSCVNTVAQFAALYALKYADKEAEDMRRRFVERKRIIVELLKKVPKTEFLEPKGTFFLLLSIKEYLGRRADTGVRVNNDIGFAEALLKKEAVATVPGSPFGAEGCIRISFATSEEMIREGCRRIARFITSLV